MKRSCLLPLATALLLAGCGHQRPVAAGAQAAPARASILPEDRARLRNWRTTFVAALAQARAGGHGAEIAAEGALLDPDAALEMSLPPPGDYVCRTVKLGAQAPGGRVFARYRVVACRIAAGRDGALHLAKLGGSQRPVGDVLPGPGVRLVFLGAVMMGDETSAYDYGADAQRSAAGFVERIGPAQWRLVLPQPRFESLFDVIELIPATS